MAANMYSLLDYMQAIFSGWAGVWLIRFHWWKALIDGIRTWLIVRGCEGIYNASISFKSVANERPTAYARLTGTAFPICLYCAVTFPSKYQSSGNV